MAEGRGARRTRGLAATIVRRCPHCGAKSRPVARCQAMTKRVWWRPASVQCSIKAGPSGFCGWHAKRGR